MPEKIKQTTISQRYLYSVGWSELDEAFVARAAEFPSLSAHGDSLEAALREINFVVEAVIEDLKQAGEDIPEPIGSCLRPASGVEFEAHCAIDIQMERLIQRGMMITAESREAVIRHALWDGLRTQDYQDWLALLEKKEERRKRA